MKIHYVSLLSEGPPHDNGLSLGHLAKNVSDIMSKYYDKVNVYTPKEIPVEHRKEYDATIFETRYNPGYHNIGYGAFKPYLILKTLEETDCDIVVWRDSNIEKCPFYLEGLDQVKSLIEEVLNYTKTDIFIPFENPQWLVGHTTPSIVFETILGCITEEYIGYPQMNAALVICKKTDYTKAIMKEWIKWMQYDEFFLKSQIRKHSFNMNCGDQGVLNVLILKEIIDGRLPQGWPYLGYTQRRFIKNKIYHIVNTPALTRNSLTSQNISMNFIMNQQKTKLNLSLQTAQDNVQGNKWTELCEIMNLYKSDKSNFHNYTKVYSALFSDLKESAEDVLEIGIGTNNTDVVSNMGANGTPGASLRGWREYFKKAHIWGCDVDKRILFDDDRISTFFLDQLQDNVDEFLPEDKQFDIIIDDGLHDHAVNFFVLRKLFKRLKPGGYYIIEDLVKHNQLNFLFKNWDPNRMPEIKDYEWVYLDIPGGSPYDNALFVVMKNKIDI